MFLDVRANKTLQGEKTMFESEEYYILANDEEEQPEPELNFDDDEI